MTAFRLLLVLVVAWVDPCGVAALRTVGTEAKAGPAESWWSDDVVTLGNVTRPLPLGHPLSAGARSRFAPRPLGEAEAWEVAFFQREDEAYAAWLHHWSEATARQRGEGRQSTKRVKVSAVPEQGNWEASIAPLLEFFTVANVASRTAKRKAQYSDSSQLASQVDALAAASVLLWENLQQVQAALAAHPDQQSYRKLVTDHFPHAQAPTVATDVHPVKPGWFLPAVLPFPVLLDSAVLTALEKEISDLEFEAGIAAKQLARALGVEERRQSVSEKASPGHSSASPMTPLAVSLKNATERLGEVVALPLTEMVRVMNSNREAHKVITRVALPLLDEPISRLATEITRLTALSNSIDETKKDDVKVLKSITKRRNSLSSTFRMLSGTQRNLRSSYEANKPATMASLLAALVAIVHWRFDRDTGIAQLDSARPFSPTVGVTKALGMQPSEALHLLALPVIAGLIICAVQVSLTRYAKGLILDRSSNGRSGHAARRRAGGAQRLLIACLLLTDQVMPPVTTTACVVLKELRMGYWKTELTNMAPSLRDIVLFLGTQPRGFLALLLLGAAVSGIRVAHFTSSAWAAIDRASVPHGEPGSTPAAAASRKRK